jgi:hypothetical protein
VDLVDVVEHLGRLAERVAGVERGLVRGEHELVVLEPALDPLERRLDRPRVHPRDQPEGEEVLGPVGVTRLDPERAAHLFGDAGHRDSMQRVPRE